MDLKSSTIASTIIEIKNSSIRSLRDIQSLEITDSKVKITLRIKTWEYTNINIYNIYIFGLFYYEKQKLRSGVQNIKPQ